MFSVCTYATHALIPKDMDPQSFSFNINDPQKVNNITLSVCVKRVCFEMPYFT